MSVRYCGRDFSEEELARIRQLIPDNPDSSRAELSRLTCRLLQWYKADGGLKEMSARVAMLRMQEDGLLQLPPPRAKRPDPTVHPTSRTDPADPVETPAGKLGPLVLKRVQQKADSSLWNEYVQRYHYLGHSVTRSQASTWRSAAVLRPGQQPTPRLVRLWRRRLANGPA